jgi:transcriptional regulator with XRE-family HTH domain
MTTQQETEPFADLRPTAAAATNLSDLAGLLRLLRRRHGRRHPGGPLTYRELARKLGSSHGIIGEYLTGHVLPPVDRLDALVVIFGGSLAERRLLADLRDDIQDARRRPGTAG